MVVNLKYELKFTDTFGIKNIFLNATPSAPMKSLFLSDRPL